MINMKVKTIDSDPNNQRFRVAVKELEKYHTLVGYPGDLGVHKGKGRSKEGSGSSLTIAEVAAIHELGSPARNIPKRPFMALAADNKDNLAYASRLSERLLSSVVGGTLLAQQAVYQLGEMWIGMIKKSLIKGPFVPLSPRTVKAKKSSVPLFASGQLRNSVTQRVVSGIFGSKGSK